MSKGKKTCPDCSAVVGCRKMKCECGHEFMSPMKYNKKSTTPVVVVENADPNPFSEEEISA